MLVHTRGNQTKLKRLRQYIFQTTSKEHETKDILYFGFIDLRVDLDKGKISFVPTKK